MRLRTVDLRLIFGLIIAHLLLFFSFQDRSIFWYILTGSLLLLIAFSMFQKEVDDQASFFTYILYGILSGLLLYGIFWVVYKGISLFHIPVLYNISRLYRWYAPSEFWHYLALIIVVVPGEEFFWRGFVQKRLSVYYKPAVSILIGALLYSSVLVYSREWILILTFFLTGLAWGTMYFWKKSMPMTIVSHMIFDILLFIILPLK